MKFTVGVANPRDPARHVHRTVERSVICIGKNHAGLIGNQPGREFVGMAAHSLAAPLNPIKCGTQVRDKSVVADDQFIELPAG